MTPTGRLARAAVLAALGALLAAGTSAAADSLATANPAPRPLGTAPARPSPGVAALLSNAAVALPIIASTQVAKHADTRTRNHAEYALVSAAVVAGPAIGYLYGGCAGRGLRGAAVRAAGVGAIAGLAAGAPSLGDAAAGLIVPVGIFGVIVAGSAIWDMATVGNTVAARNRARLHAGAAPFSGAPALVIELRP